MTTAWQDRQARWLLIAGRQSRWDAAPLLFDGIPVRRKHADGLARRSLELTAFAGL